MQNELKNRFMRFPERLEHSFGSKNCFKDCFAAWFSPQIEQQYHQNFENYPTNVEFMFFIENDGQSFSCQLISVYKSFPLHIILRYWSSCCQQFQLTWVLNWKMRYARIFGRAFRHYGHVPWHWKCQKSFFYDVFHQSWPYDFFLSSSWDFR